MKLPKLPKQNKHREADSSLILRHYLRSHPGESCAIEVKDSRGKDNIPFSAIEDNQISYGLAIKSDKGVLIRVQGSGGEPDFIYLRRTPSRVAIKFIKKIHILDIETFLDEKNRSKRKSLTEDRAGELAVKSIVCK